MTTIEIKNIIENELNISLDENTRKRENVYARALYCKISKDKTNSTLKEIGRLINKDHATVMHAINNVFEQIELCEPRLYQIYQELVDSDKLKAIEEKYIDLVEENEQLKEKVKELQKFRNKFKTNFRTVFH